MVWLRHRTKAAEGPLALTARQFVGSAAPERHLGESLEEVLRHTCVTLLLTEERQL